MSDRPSAWSSAQVYVSWSRQGCSTAPNTSTAHGPCRTPTRCPRAPPGAPRGGSGLPVCDPDKIATFDAAAGSHRLSSLSHDGREVLCAGVFGSDHRVIGELGQDIPHQSTLLAIPQPRTAKDNQDVFPSRGQITRSCERRSKGVRCVAKSTMAVKGCPRSMRSMRPVTPVSAATPSTIADGGTRIAPRRRPLPGYWTH